MGGTLQKTEPGGGQITPKKIRTKQKGVPNMLSESQMDLIFEFTYKHFGDDAEQVLNEYSLTGPHGLRRVLGEIDIEFFARAYLSDQFSREFGDYAREILWELKSSIESQVQEKKAVVAPREHGKSTYSSFAIPTWAAVYDKKKFILFISANSDTSENFLKKIQKALESPEIVEDFGNMKGQVWNADQINLRNNAWIACTGWKSGLRGMNKDTRPDLIILDDLEDKATIESESLRKKLELAFREEIGRLGYYKTDFFYIGTLLSEDALLANVIKDPAWKVLFYKCVISFPEREDLWDSWRTKYRDISNDNRFDDAYNFYLENKDEMLRGSQVLWPGRFPDDELKYKGAYYNIMISRETWGENSFWKEDQNEPRSAGEKIFPGLTYWENYPEGMFLKMTIDPSEGKGDTAGISIGGKFKGACYLKEGHVLRLTPTKLIEFIVEKVRMLPQISEIVIEDNLFKELGTDLLKQTLIRKGMNRKITGVRNTKNKHNRIMQIEPYITGGLVLFNRASLAYNNQVMDYQVGCKNDDAADSLEMLLCKLDMIKNRKPIRKPKGW